MEIQLSSFAGERWLCALRSHRKTSLFCNGHGTTSFSDKKSRQTDGIIRGGRSGIATAQMRILHERHRTDVFVFVTRENHSIPSVAVPERAE